MDEIYKIQDLPALVIGREVDHLTRKVSIDCSRWLQLYPELVRYHIEVVSPSGQTYIPTEVSMENGILIWVITNNDTAVDGTGEYQIVALGNNGERKTSPHRALTVRDRIQGTTSGTSPDQMKPYIDTVVEAAVRAEAAAREAREIADNIAIGGGGEGGSVDGRVILF